VNSSTDRAEIGFVVDAGPGLGYGHAVRCVRLARALAKRNSVVFYPLSAACEQFIESFGFSVGAVYDRAPCAIPTIKNARSQTAPAVNGTPFAPLVITDLREAHGITAAIHRNGSRHISIHDLGLAQCHSDVAIDGSVTRLFPYSMNRTRELFLGPEYMITRDVVPRDAPGDSVFVTLGGGSTAQFAAGISEQLSRLGLKTVLANGFAGSAPLSDAQYAEAISTCRFAISGSGTTLYDLLASGVPTIAVAFDRVQLRTADAFHERGAVLSAGLLPRLSPAALLRSCMELLENRSLVQRITRAGQMLVDGKGLSRVVEIVRRQLWLTSQEKIYTVC
jgi:spore coat polysaccharide biosynthesis predicted glycosyltransferase SpsG